VLDERPREPEPRKAAAVDPALARERRELQLMQASLTRLLDELPDNRRSLRHLAFMEHALGKKGVKALQKVPYDVLKRALEQFEAVVVNWSDEGLATLRSKMAVALIEREVEVLKAAPEGDRHDAPDSIADTVPLAEPVTLEGDDAAEAEAALRAAYGSALLPGLDLAPPGPGTEPDLELQGELHSPSAKAIAKSARRGADARLATASG
jgi:hypothetical protein